MPFMLLHTNKARIYTQHSFETMGLTHTQSYSMVAMGAVVWLYGGEDKTSRIFNDLWSFDTISTQWFQAPRLISSPSKGKSRHSITKACAVLCAHIER
jgi:hypothetical protein